MSLSLSEVRRGLIAAGEVSAAPSRVGRLGAIFLPLILILLWTAAVRLPFSFATDKDEFFFAVIASGWLEGALPYVATFDIKPPGLFFLYAVAQALFGASQATVKAMEIVAVAVSAWALYAALNAWALRRLAVWVAVLLPVYTLAFGGFIAVNVIVQLPFTILAFVAALAAVREDAPTRPRLAAAAFAGLSIGAAGMIKQTAAFEAIALLVALVVFGGRGRRLASAVLFVAGTAIVPLAFASYFLAVGHFEEMFRAVVLLSLQRADTGVAASYPAELQWYFTVPGAVVNSFLTSGPLIFLWGGAIFVGMRFTRIAAAVPSLLLAISVLWLIAAFAGVVAGRAICSYYLLTMVPPLLILAGAFFSYGLDVPDSERGRAFIVSVVAAAACLVLVDRDMRDSFQNVMFGDYGANRRISQAIIERAPEAGDRLLVVNRGYASYVETGLRPPTPYFHATHLLGYFNTASPDPLGEALAANPRFVIMADPAVRHVTELPERIDRAVAYIARHYRPVAVEQGAVDRFTLYEFAG